MYNEDLKKRFIKECVTKKTTEDMFVRIFNSTEEYERGWGADLCTRRAEELQPVVDKICGMRSRSIIQRVGMLKKYIHWCMESQVEGACEEINLVKVSGIDNVRRQTVPDPEHLQRYLDVICDPEWKGTNDNILRGYHWLLYSGVTEEDIFSIHCGDVELKEKIIHYNKKHSVVRIYEEAIPAITNCAELKQFRYYNPSYSEVIFRDRVSGDILLRGIRAVGTAKSIRSDVSKRNNAHFSETNLRLSQKRLWLSGVFYRLYEMEKKGVSPDFYSVARLQMEGRHYSTEGTTRIENTRSIIAKACKEDYERWKIAWNLT